MSSNFPSANKQRGTSLIEAIIALVLVSIITSGAIVLSGRSYDSQAELAVQEIAISQIRSALINNGTGGSDLCSTAPTVTLPNGTVLTAPAVEVQGCGNTVTATVTTTQNIPGATVTVPEPLRISITHESVGGQMVIGGTWKSQ